MNDEVLGIAPGPEKIETLLNALSRAAKLVYCGHPKHREKMERQEAAFRARILREFLELEAEVESERNWANFYMQQAEDNDD